MLISTIKNLSKFISKNDPIKKMGLINNMAKEAIREIGNKSREFYEFVLPPIDMHLEDNNLIVTIDIPGFNKEDIKLTIHKNILSIGSFLDINFDRFLIVEINMTTTNDYCY